MWWNSSKALKGWSVSQVLFTKTSVPERVNKNPKFLNHLVQSQKKLGRKSRNWRQLRILDKSDNGGLSRHEVQRKLLILFIRNGERTLKPWNAKHNLINFFNCSLEIYWDNLLTEILQQLFFFFFQLQAKITYNKSAFSCNFKWGSNLGSLSCRV